MPAMQPEHMHLQIINLSELLKIMQPAKLNSTY